MLMKMVALAILSGPAWALDPTGDEAPVSKVYIPSGYDDNDTVEIMVSGEFPNGCYRLGAIDVEIPANGQPRGPYLIRVKAIKYLEDDNSLCLQAKVKFLAPVKLRSADEPMHFLTDGVHEVVVNPGPREVRKVFAVGKRRSDAPDENDYAPVERGQIVSDRKSSTGQALVLEGRYPMMLKGCVVVTEVRQNRDAEDLLTVLPIMTAYNDERCNQVSNSFKLNVPLEIPFQNEGLLHVRKIDGESYNTLVRPE